MKRSVKAFGFAALTASLALGLTGCAESYKVEKPTLESTSAPSKNNKSDGDSNKTDAKSKEETGQRPSRKTSSDLEQRPETLPVMLFIEAILNNEPARFCQAIEPNYVAAMGGAEACVKAMAQSLEEQHNKLPKDVDLQPRISGIESTGANKARVTVDMRGNDFIMNVTKNADGAWYFTLDDLSGNKN